MINYESHHITGKELQEFLNATPSDYLPLYPHLGEEGYCPARDLFLEHNPNLCKGMFTVMDFMEKEEIINFPKIIKKIISLGKYRTGEVWVDNMCNIAYLYLGKLDEGKVVYKEKDVVLNLGGETPDSGLISIGHIGNAKEKSMFFTKRVFPK